MGVRINLVLQILNMSTKSLTPRDLPRLSCTKNLIKLKMFVQTPLEHTLISFGNIIQSNRQHFICRTFPMSPFVSQLVIRSFNDLVI